MSSGLVAAQVIETVQSATGESLRRCSTPGCGHALARLGARGGIYPLVPKVYVEDGSLMLVCPICNRRHRLAVRGIGACDT